MRQTIQAFALGTALMFAPAAVHAQAEVEQTQDAVADPETTIIVTGESDREVVEELGKIITRPSRAGKPNRSGNPGQDRRDDNARGARSEGRPQGGGQSGSRRGGPSRQGNPGGQGGGRPQHRRSGSGSGGRPRG